MSDTPLFVTLHHYNFDSIFNDCHISIMNNALITRMEKWYNNSFLLLEEKTNNDYILCLSLLSVLEFCNYNLQTLILLIW